MIWVGPSWILKVLLCKTLGLLPPTELMAGLLPVSFDDEVTPLTSAGYLTFKGKLREMAMWALSGGGWAGQNPACPRLPETPSRHLLRPATPCHAESSL